MGWFEEMEKAEQEREAQEYECAMAFKAGYNKAIDDYTCYVIHEEAIGNIKSLDDYDRIAERLKRGGKNE